MRFRFLLAAVFLASTANAAEIDVGLHTLTLSGPVKAGDFQKFSLAVSQQTLVGNEITTINLDSPGGVLGDGSFIAASVRELKLKTHVLAGATCASACFTIFVAGQSRSFDPGARIGVHRGRLSVSGDDFWIGTHLMTRVNEMMGAPLAVLEKAEETPSDEISWLSDDDLAPLTHSDAPSLPPGTIMKATMSVIQQYSAELSHQTTEKPTVAPTSEATPKTSTPPDVSPWIPVTPASATQKFAARCFFEFNGKRYINQPCIYDTKADGSFSVGADETDLNYFARVVKADDGSMLATWNGAPSNLRADISIGRVLPQGACWTNENTKICAWKFDAKSDRTTSVMLAKAEKKRQPQEPKSLIDGFAHALGIDP